MKSDGTEHKVYFTTTSREYATSNAGYGMAVCQTTFSDATFTTITGASCARSFESDGSAPNVNANINIKHVLALNMNDGYSMIV